MCSGRPSRAVRNRNTMTRSESLEVPPLHDTLEALADAVETTVILIKKKSQECAHEFATTSTNWPGTK